jgi:RNA polymerase sigma-70 factor (ECF subfamily)
METREGAAMVDCAVAETVQTLYRATGRAAISKVEHLVGRRDVAEEVTQEVYLRLWKQKPCFPSEKQAYTWIYKSCHNAGLDYLRSASARRERAHDAPFFDTLSEAATADRSIQRDFVLRMLEGLDEREAAILGYTVIDGMTQDEVASLIGVSRKTVVRAVARLEAKLREIKEVHHAAHD